MSIQSQIDRIIGFRDDSFDAVASKGVTVPANATIDDLPDLIMAIPTGSGSAISIVDTTDANGGTIRTITGVSLAGDTVTAATLLNGVTAHNSLGEAITGSYMPSGASTQSNKTVSPTESQQVVTPDTGYDNLAQVTVNAISSTYVGSDVATKAAATITPTKSTQTIASGTYLTGTQTIAAIPVAYQDVTGVTAAAGDVVSGKTIVDSTGATVNGSLVIQHYYTGSSTPSSSLGVNGDIYLKTS